jgi:AcrR family transcriptional regulator
VLHAADDLLVEIGYGAMTMKNIAERAGVGRQTVYRWWPHKAEILLEACRDDFAEELSPRPRADPADDLFHYLRTLGRFLLESPAGLAYRALVGAAQHDPDVRGLVTSADLLSRSAAAVVDRVRPSAPAMPPARLAAAQLVGPVLTQILTAPAPLPPRLLREHVRTLLAGWTSA